MRGRRTVRALLALNLQEDFADDGPLAIAGARKIAAGVTDLVKRKPSRWRKILAAKDRHVFPGSHFSDWPVHCLEGTAGASFMPEVDPSIFSHTFYKGMHDE